MVDPDRPTSADVPEFPPDQVRAGDLVFFAGGDHLSRMLAEVDGVILTQVGIALGDGTVVSCRTDGAGPLDPSAGGGVRRDALAWWREDQGRFALVGRIGPEDLAPDRPEYAAVRDRAARFARRCLEHPTWFSATKTVLPVLAIGTMPPFPEFTAADGAAMVDLAVAAGDAWRAGAEQPVYAGSEFVATALDTRFTRHDLQPKSLVLLDSSDDRPEPDYRDLVVAVLAEQRQTVATSLLCDLADRLQRHHPRFMPDVVGPLAAIVADPDAPSPTRLREAFHRPVPGGDRPIPASLVTPRVLVEAAWVGDVLPLGR
ncbi:MAG: Permuted papain-like amidase enzyme YaeF/YiiX, family [Actinomycetospora sp.]|jgi:hypothetical protein|nr:Permuted papain-like amidase enzyme YaeF/YiiX, family [Actinomycetospora sp.]